MEACNSCVPRVAHRDEAHPGVPASQARQCVVQSKETDMDVPREQLRDAIIAEIEHIFGEESFSENWEAYDWFLQHYGVTEYEDVRSRFIRDADAIEEPDDIELIPGCHLPCGDCCVLASSSRAEKIATPYESIA